MEAADELVSRVIPWVVQREATYEACLEPAAYARLLHAVAADDSDTSASSSADATEELLLDEANRKAPPPPPPRRPLFRRSRHAYISAVIGLLSIRRYTETFELAEIWGGYAFLLPYTVAVVLLGWPLMTLEICLGNLLRGGISKSFEAVSSATRLVAPITLAVTLLTKASLVYELTHYIGTACGYWSQSPGWIPLESIRVDCEQTKPSSASCPRKEGCILFDGVCTYDPIYWAQADTTNRQSVNDSTIWAIVVAYIIVLFAAQGFHFKLRSIFLCSVTILGLTLLLYFSIQLNLETVTLKNQDEVHASVYPVPKVRPLTAGLPSLRSPVLWYETTVAALTTLGIGTGFNHCIGASAPFGLNGPKVAAVVCGCDVLLLSLFTVISFSVIGSLAEKVNKSLGAVLKPLPNLIGTILPAAIGDVTHKRYVASIILLLITVGGLASCSIFFFTITEDVAECAALPASASRQRFFIFFVLACLIVGIVGLHIYMSDGSHGSMSTLYSLYYHQVWSGVALMECLCWGWIKYSKRQIKYIGSYSVHLWMFTFTVLMVIVALSFVTVLGCLDKIKIHVATWVEALAYVVFAGVLLLLFGLAIAAARRAFRINKTRIVQSVVSQRVHAASLFSTITRQDHALTRAQPAPRGLGHGALWWLLVGNIEHLRWDFNSLLAGRSAFRLDMYWSLCIKYIAPMLLILTMYHRFEDSDASKSGNCLTVGYLGLVEASPAYDKQYQIVWGMLLPCFILLLGTCLVAVVTLWEPSLGSLLRPAANAIPSLTWWPRTDFAPAGPRCWSAIKNTFLREFTCPRRDDVVPRTFETDESVDSRGWVRAEECADDIIDRCCDSANNS